MELHTILRKGFFIVLDCMDGSHVRIDKPIENSDMKYKLDQKKLLFQTGNLKV